jgi:hypothetical protein
MYVYMQQIVRVVRFSCLSGGLVEVQLASPKHVEV